MSTAQQIAGRFTIDKEIGNGGMGIVYRGIDTRTKRVVAIKQLKADVLALDDEFLERFKREGQALRRLNHPNIVKVQAFFEDNNAHYLIMEYVRGGSLADLLEEKTTLPLNQTLTLALEVADALARAHHLNVIHRDIKPANVLIADDGTPRLTDFGLAHLGDRSRLTQAHTVMGTLEYLSPEALDGKSGDARTDVWSFGIMLYKMLTGNVPFDEKSSGATISAIFTKSLPAMHEIRDDMTPELYSLLLRMLEKDYHKRIDNMRAIGGELYAMIHGTQTYLPTISMDTLGSGGTSHVAVQKLISDITDLSYDWENRAFQTEQKLGKSQMGDMETMYYQRGIAKTMRQSADELRKAIEASISIPTDDDSESYAETTQDEADAILKKAGLRYNNLYEDNGYIFTAIFPKMMIMSLDERVKRLKQVAPNVVILDTGKLQDSGEQYIDFAFSET